MERNSTRRNRKAAQSASAIRKFSVELHERGVSPEQEQGIREQQKNLCAMCEQVPLGETPLSIWNEPTTPETAWLNVLFVCSSCFGLVESGKIQIQVGNGDGTFPSLPSGERALTSSDLATNKQYVVRKTYPGGRFFYFLEEDKYRFAWTPDKAQAHRFPNRFAALEFAHHTEAFHDERIKDGKSAGSDVVILEA